MTAEQLKEEVLKAEGYSIGFRDGYTSCAKMVVMELEKEKKETKTFDTGETLKVG